MRPTLATALLLLLIAVLGTAVPFPLFFPLREAMEPQVPPLIQVVRPYIASLVVLGSRGAVLVTGALAAVMEWEPATPPAVDSWLLAAQRIGAFALGISTCLLGWGVLGARMKPRWLGWAGVASGVIAIALAVLFGEATKADQAAFVLPVLWQFVTAVVLLAERSRA